MSYKIKEKTALFILLVIGFVFFHSELDQLSSDEDNHDTHDYCELVKDTTLQLTKTSNGLIKLKIGKSHQLHFSQIAIATINHSNKFDFNQHYTPQKTSEIYIYNDSFLI